MKKVLLLLLAAFSFYSCSQVETENVSKVTTYPKFEYNQIAVLPLGSVFSPVAKAYEGTKELKINVVGTVNTSKVGVYDVVYEAVNVDGFKAAVTQKVVVHDPAVVGNDVSGRIRDKVKPVRTAVISLVPGTKSIFYCTDFAFGGPFPMYFQMNGNVISEISQVYPLDQTSVNLTYDPVAKIFTTKVNPAGFSYTFEYY